MIYPHEYRVLFDLVSYGPLAASEIIIDRRTIDGKLVLQHPSSGTLRGLRDRGLIKSLGGKPMTWAAQPGAGWYASAYLGEELTREETEGRLDELLALERAA